MADNAYTKLPLTGQLGVSAGIALLIGGLFWYLYWSDTAVERDEKTAKLEALNKEIRALEVTAQKLGEFQREVALLEKKLETLKTILPPAKETPDLMRKVQALAAQSNLTINNFTPGPTVNKEFYQEWPITMGLVGNFHNLALFFDKVSRLPRLVNVGNLKINSLGAQTVSNTIGVGSTATTFVYIETPPAGARPPAAGAR
jgi:type IV pilus assembly protein PilO